MNWNDFRWSMIIIYGIFSFVALMIGLTDQSVYKKCIHENRRIAKIVPAYKLGCYIYKPLNKMARYLGEEVE